MDHTVLASLQDARQEERRVPGVSLIGRCASFTATPGYSLRRLRRRDGLPQIWQAVTPLVCDVDHVSPDVSCISHDITGLAA